MYAWFRQSHPPTLVEETALTKAEISAGHRLACQAEPLSDVKLDIPPESLTAPQRLQLDGKETRMEIRPAVHTPGAHGLAVDIGTTKLATVSGEPGNRTDCC